GLNLSYTWLLTGSVINAFRYSGYADKSGCPIFIT
ncbi:unnamed protein product, partial [marine sediment metagenome]